MLLPSMAKPKDYGIYALLLLSSSDAKIAVGKLGRIRFEKGYYVYIGSAQRCLQARIKRHMATTKKKIWHIDYITTRFDFVGVYIFPVSKKYEDVLAAFMAEKFAAIPGFGAADAHVKSHLFYCKNFADILVALYDFGKSLNEDFFVLFLRKNRY